MRKKILIGILVVLLLGIARYEQIRMSYPPGTDCCQAPDQKLLTYKNDTYGIEFQYPADWQVRVDESIPVINVYKKSETDTPPFTIHSKAAAVSIFPDGLGTEGPQGETRPTNIIFQSPLKQGTDFLLQNGQPWATVAYFNASSTRWSEYAFVWANTYVENLDIVCVVDDKEQSMENCGMGVEFIGANVIRKGTTSAKDREIEVKILQSIKVL